MSGWTDDDDGWDEESVDLEDDDDIFVDDEEEEEPPPQQGVSLGGGMFIGRLTQFISDVASPAARQEEEEEEDHDDEEEEEEQEAPRPFSLASRLSAMLSPPKMGASGWDDDDDLDGIDEGSGWDDVDELEGLDDDTEGDLESVEEPETTQAPLPPIEPNNIQQRLEPDTNAADADADAEGWGDDINLDDDELLEEETIEPAPLPAAAVVQPPPPPHHPEQRHQPQTSVASGGMAERETEVVDGWGDGSSGLEGISEPAEARRAKSPLVVGWSDSEPEVIHLDAWGDDSALDGLDESNELLDAQKTSDTIATISDGESAHDARRGDFEKPSATKNQATESEQEDVIVDGWEDSSGLEGLDDSCEVQQESITDGGGITHAGVESEPQIVHDNGGTREYRFAGGDSEHSTVVTLPIIAEASERAPADVTAHLSDQIEEVHADGWDDVDIEILDELPPIEEENPSTLVDQVPEGQAPIVQRDSTAAMASDQSGTLEEDMDTVVQYFGRVVDHLPPPDRPASAVSESVATQVRFEELDQDENEVGEDTEPGETSEEPKNVHGPSVVDHIPTIRAARSSVRSTIAVASQQSSTVMEDVWREDFDPSDDDYGPVVDHLPPPVIPTTFVSSIRSVPSMTVQGAIAEEDDDNEEDTVDQRRAAMFSAGASIADSLAAVAPIAEHDENTVGQTIDGHTVDGVDGEDDETVSNAFPTLDGISLAATRDEPLVDHVPLRPETRPTDASTLILADPSEVSTVGDMTYEDMEYGPVVDHTPPPRPLSWRATAAASVVVAATKSECPDDLEDEMDEETYAMGTGDDGATLETSLGDENLNRDQLVDHVPEGPGLRRIQSSSTMAEGQSVISTRDDEFGLVVDHTPIPPIGSSPFPKESLGPLAPLSECETLASEEIKSLPESLVGRQVEIDKVPVSTASRADSLYSVRSMDGNEDVDTIEEMPAIDEFGPVVDQTPSVRTPIASSRGGSISGVLATLSEYEFDGNTVDADADGWEEDDQELLDDVTNAGEIETDADPYCEEFKGDTPETRNKSVTFQTLDGAPLFPTLAPNSPKSQRLLIVDDGADNESANKSLESVQSNDCFACARANTLDCPCVQRIISTEGEPDAAIVRRTTPEGIPIDVDYNKLLQDEIAKRLLLEQEVGKYQQLVESLQSHVSQTTTAKVYALEEVKQLEKANSELMESLGKHQQNSASLEVKVSTLEDKSNNAERRLKELEQSEVDNANSAAKALKSSQSKQSELDAALENQANLTKQVAELSNAKLVLEQRLEASTDQIVAKESKWAAQESEYQQELQRLRQMLASTASAKDVEEHYQQSIASLEANLDIRSKEFDSLREKLSESDLKRKEGEVMVQLRESQIRKMQADQASRETQYQKELENVTSQKVSSENRLKDITEELYAVSETKDQLKSRFQGLLDIADQKMELETVVSRLEAESASLLSKCQDTEHRLVQMESERDMHKESSFLNASRIEELKGQLNAMISEKSRVNAEVETALQRSEAEAASLLARLEEMKHHLVHIEGERDMFKEASLVNASKVEELQGQLDDSISEKTQLKAEFEAAIQRLEADAASLLEECNGLGNHASQIEGERNELKESYQATTRKVKELQGQLNEMLSEKARAGAEVEATIRRLEAESASLLAKYQDTEQRLTQAESERDMHVEKSRVNASKAEELQDQLKAILSEKSGANTEVEHALQRLEAESASFLAKCQDLEQRLSQTEVERDMYKESDHAKTSKIEELSEQLNAIASEQVSSKTDFEAAVKRSEIEVASLLTKCQDLEHHVSQIEGERSILKEDSLMYKNKVAEVQSQLDAILSEKTNAIAEMGASMRRLETEASTLLAKCQDLEHSLLQIGGERDMYKEDSQVNLRKIEALKSQIDAMTSEKAKADVEVEAGFRRLEAQVGSLSAKCQDLEHNMFQMEGERDMYKEDSRVNSSKVEELCNQMRVVLSEKTDMEKHLSSLEMECERQLEIIASFEERTKSLNNALNQAKENQIPVSLSKEYLSQQAVIDDLKSKLDFLEVEVREKDSSLQILQSRFESVSCEVAKYKNEREKIVQQHNEMQQNIDRAYKELQTRCADLEQKLSLVNSEHQTTLEQLSHRNEIEVQLRGDIDMLLSERDTILSERRGLEEECEEMLVQLGLDKEQMDANEKEISALHSALRTSESANVRASENLKVAEDKVRKLEARNLELQGKQIENGSKLETEASRLENMVQKLVVENADLRQQVDDLMSAAAYNSEELDNAILDRDSIKKRLQEIESTGASHGNMNETIVRFEVEMKELEARNVNLDNVCTAQKSEIDSLALSLHQAEEAIEHFKHEAVAKHERLVELENILEHRENELRQEGDAVQEVRQQLEDFRRMSTGPDKNTIAELSRSIDELTSRLRESESLSSAKEIQLDKVETAYSFLQEEIKQAKENLTNTEETLLRMELEIDKRDEEAATIREEYEIQLNEVRAALAQREEYMKELELQCEDMQHRLSSATTELSAEKASAALKVNRDELFAKQNELTMKQKEVESLKLRLLQVQHDGDSLVVGYREREESIRKEIASLQVAVQTKSNKLTNLEQQVQGLSLELSTSQNLLSAKEEDLLRVSLELEETRAEQLEATQRITAKVLDSDMSKEEAENTDNMRGLIISLSQALEKSESQRADAIERLLRERKTNAESLKRLGESVRRFYSTLNGASG